MAENRIPLYDSGFCRWPGRDNLGHTYCTSEKCRCSCHTKEEE